MNELATSVSPLQSSETYGIDLYTATVHFCFPTYIASHISNNSKRKASDEWLMMRMIQVILCGITPTQTEQSSVHDFFEYWKLSVEVYLNHTG